MTPAEGSDLGTWPAMPFALWLQDVFVRGGRGLVEAFCRQQRVTAGDQMVGAETAALGYVREVFSGAGRYLVELPVDTVGAGLLNLVAGNYCNDLDGLLNEAVPAALQYECIASVPSLFEALVAAPRRAGRTRPRIMELVAETWWPSWAMRGVGCVDNDLLCLRQMETILGLGDPLCQRSALLGLGYYVYHYPSAAREIIDRFLARNAALDRSLEVLARAALRGDTF